MRSTHQSVIDFLASGQIDEEATKTIESVMADVAAQYK